MHNGTSSYLRLGYVWFMHWSQQLILLQMSRVDVALDTPAEQLRVNVFIQLLLHAVTGTTCSCVCAVSAATVGDAMWKGKTVLLWFR